MEDHKNFMSNFIMKSVLAKAIPKIGLAIKCI
mgnify:CR=1 FL=1